MAGAVADMALAGLAEVERVGSTDRIRLAAGTPFRSWLPARGAPAHDEAARWRCVLAARDLAERIDGAPDTVRAVERRAAVDGLRRVMASGGLPRPDLTVLGVAFAAEFDAWLDPVALAIAP